MPAQLSRMYDILKLKSFKAVRDRNQVLLDYAEMIQVYMAGGSTYAVLWKHFPAHIADLSLDFAAWQTIVRYVAFYHSLLSERSFS